MTDKSAEPNTAPKFLSKTGRDRTTGRRTHRLSTQLVDPMNEPPVNPDHILEVRTVNGTTLRNIVESLKNVLDDANMVFSEKGIRVTMADNHEICACILNMDASFFERYHCVTNSSEPLTLGIHPGKFFRILKDVNSSTTVSLILHKRDRGILHIILENEETGWSSDAELVLRMLPNEHWVLDSNTQLEFHVDPPEIPSSELQRMFRQFHVLHAKEVEIKHIVRPDKDVVTFRCLGGDMNKTESITVFPAEGEEHLRPEPQEISARFLLYYLKQITNSATRISPKIRISLRQDNCMLLEYVLTGKENRLRYLLFQVDNE